LAVWQTIKGQSSAPPVSSLAGNPALRRLPRRNRRPDATSCLWCYSYLTHALQTARTCGRIQVVKYLIKLLLKLYEQKNHLDNCWCYRSNSYNCSFGVSRSNAGTVKVGALFPLTGGLAIYVNRLKKRHNWLCKILMLRAE